MSVNLRKVAIIGAISGTLAGVGHASLAGGDQLPWERPDGTVIPENLPSSLPLLDCEGNIVGRRANPLAISNAQPWTPPRLAGNDCPADDEAPTEAQDSNLDPPES